MIDLDNKSNDMRHSKIQIQSVTDLSHLYGIRLIEFQTNATEQFNQSISDIMLWGEQKYRLTRRDFLDKEKELGASNAAADPEWWHAYSLDTRFKIHKDWNFFSFSDPNVVVLRNLILKCLSHYLNQFKTEYRGKVPNYYHSWSVFCRKTRTTEPPHIHHFNPMNIAGVYYVSGNFKPGNGDLEIFPDPKSPEYKLSYQPRPGRLIFFPANLPHAIGNYEGSIARFSIGLDMWFVKPTSERSWVNI